MSLSRRGLFAGLFGLPALTLPAIAAKHDTSNDLIPSDVLPETARDMRAGIDQHMVCDGHETIDWLMRWKFNSHKERRSFVPVIGWREVPYDPTPWRKVT